MRKCRHNMYDELYMKDYMWNVFMYAICMFVAAEVEMYALIMKFVAGKDYMWKGFMYVICMFVAAEVEILIMKFVAGKDYMWKGFMYAICMFVAAEVEILIMKFVAGKDYMWKGFMYAICMFVAAEVEILIMKFVAGKDYMWKGFMYAICMFVAAELQTIALHKYIMVMYVVGFNWRTALMSSLYKKALRISSSARQSISVGEAVNLMAVDAQRCADFGPQMHIAWTSPITIIIALYFLWGILGIATLAGLAVMAILIPINIAISKKVRTLQLRQMKLKDERVKLINEVLSGMKVLKLYAWEPSFEKHILKIREDELSLLRSGALWNASTSFFWLCSSFLVSFATFGVFVLIDERNVLTSEIAFVSTALFNVMRFPISQAPLLIQTLIQNLPPESLTND
ncbi:Canalicular multispecific organic anion transporter 1 [Homalodisca vitripennis]|nr:Canalicular multispecific organic anion transporter 1 [Homalodisca vitripennis]